MFREKEFFLSRRVECLVKGVVKVGDGFREMEFLLYWKKGVLIKFYLFRRGLIL